MPKYEVFIPPAEQDGLNLTFRVDAKNWMAALKIGLQTLGEQGAAAQNVLVDIQDDNSVHITESGSGRVFRIRELTDAEAASAKVKPMEEEPDRAPTPKETPAVSPEAITAPVHPPADLTTPGGPALRLPVSKTETAVPAFPEPPRPAPVPERAPADAPTLVASSATETKSDRMKTLPGIPLMPAQPAAPKPPPKRPSTHKSRIPVPTRAGEAQLIPDTVIELDKPVKPVVGQIGRSKPPKDKKAELEDTLSEVFEKVQEVYDRKAQEDALYFLLDLALAKIPAESGSVFRADMGSGDLRFVAARGPKAKEVLDAKIVVPAGTGIVGFCATEGVSVALSDVERDPRFYSAVSSKVNYTTRSVLCSPMMTHGRTFGCIQIINRESGSKFSEHEVGLLAYIAHQGAMYLNTQL